MMIFLLAIIIGIALAAETTSKISFDQSNPDSVSNSKIQYRLFNPIKMVITFGDVIDKFKTVPMSDHLPHYPGVAHELFSFGVEDDPLAAGVYDINKFRWQLKSPAVFCLGHLEAEDPVTFRVAIIPAISDQSPHDFPKLNDRTDNVYKIDTTFSVLIYDPDHEVPISSIAVGDKLTISCSPQIAITHANIGDESDDDFDMNLDNVAFTVIAPPSLTQPLMTGSFTSTKPGHNSGFHVIERESFQDPDRGSLAQLTITFSPEPSNGGFANAVNSADDYILYSPFLNNPLTMDWFRQQYPEIEHTGLECKDADNKVVGALILATSINPRVTGVDLPLNSVYVMPNSPSPPPNDIPITFATISATQKCTIAPTIPYSFLTTRLTASKDNQCSPFFIVGVNGYALKKLTASKIELPDPSSESYYQDTKDVMSNFNIGGPTHPEFVAAYPRKLDLADVDPFVWAELRFPFTSTSRCDNAPCNSTICLWAESVVEPVRLNVEPAGFDPAIGHEADVEVRCAHGDKFPSTTHAFVFNAATSIWLGPHHHSLTSESSWIHIPTLMVWNRVPLMTALSVSISIGPLH